MRAGDGQGTPWYLAIDAGPNTASVCQVIILKRNALKAAPGRCLLMGLTMPLARGKAPVNGIAILVVLD